MKSARVLLVALLCTLLILGCVAHTFKVLSRIELGQTKSDVRNRMGEPNAVRGAITNKYGQIVEVWEYELANAEFYTYTKTYWLYFVDGRLVQWGEAGDWRREADQIYEVRFR